MFAKSIHLFSLYYKADNNTRKSEDATSTWQSAKKRAIDRGKEKEKKNQINHVFKINFCGSDERHKKANL